MAAASTAVSDTSPPLIDPSLTNPGEDKDTPLDDGSRPSPNRRPVPMAPGGVNDNMKVLYCTGIPCKYNYKKIYLCVSSLGNIERIRLVLDQGEVYFDCYIVFQKAHDAKIAYESIKEDDIIEIRGSVKLFDIRNFELHDGDYIPKIQKNENYKHIERRIQIPMWHVIACKDGHNNILMARECLEDQVGEISDKNISRYGKNILVKAEHKTQAKLLTTFSPEDEDIVTSVSPHRSFNTDRGVVFSRDLYDYDEKEILKRCPEEVLSVKKLKGKNGAIQLTFHSSYLPDYIKIARVNMTVKRFKQRPIQCHKCFEYGHVEGNCPPERQRRCYICSDNHDLTSTCKKERYCFHCEGSHSPNWRECPSFLMEKDILEVAANEHISLGAARRRVKPWKGKKSYANATANGKTKTPANPNANKISLVQTEASKTTTAKVNKTPVISTEAVKTPATPANSEGARPKDPKPSISKQQLPASQFEIHEAPTVPEAPLISIVESNVSDTPVFSPVESSQSNAEETSTKSPPLPVQSVDEAPSEPLMETPPDMTEMESEISRTKRSRSSSPIPRNPSIKTNNRFTLLEDDEESSPSSSSTPNPSKKPEGMTKDASSKKSKILDKASVSKVKKPKIKSFFSKPLLSRSVHLAAGELSKKIRK